MRSFFSNLHRLSELLQKPLRSHCPEPGSPCLCCLRYCLHLLESEVFGPQAFPSSADVHTCPVDPLTRCLASPAREGSVGGTSAAVVLQVPAVLGSAPVAETLLPKVTLFPDSLQPLAETGPHQSVTPRTPVSAFLATWAQAFGACITAGFFLCPICPWFLPFTGVEPSEHSALNFFLESNLGRLLPISVPS